MKPELHAADRFKHGGKLILDILNEGLLNNLHLMWAKGLVLGLAYLFGWLAAGISIRVYGNLILPGIIRIYSWITLGGASILYVMILQRLFRQAYDLPHYWAYLLTVRSSDGFIPHMMDPQSNDYRNLGAMLRFRPIARNSRNP